MAERKEDLSNFKKELSNNILVMILVVIIFVSIIGTMIVVQTIEQFKDAREVVVITQPVNGFGTVGLTILPTEESDEENGGNK